MVLQIVGVCKTKYKMSPPSARGEGGEEAADHCLKSVRYRGGDTVKYNVIFSYVCN